MAAFCQLGIVEGLTGRFEIGAAVLAVGIEKQRIEPVVEIVVMRDIASRAPPPIELAQPAVEITQNPQRPGPEGRLRGRSQQDGEHVGDRALLEDERAVHVGLAELEIGIENDVTFGHPRGKPQRERLAGPIAQDVSGTARRGDLKIARANRSAQCQANQPVHHTRSAGDDGRPATPPT
jgi:hypothetical protein